MTSDCRFARELRSVTWPRAWRELIEELGVSSYELKGKAWRQTSRGFYVPAVHGGDRSTSQRIIGATPLIPPAGALGGWAAAFVSGIDDLDGRDPWTSTELPIPVLRGGDTGCLPRDWPECSRDRLPSDEVETTYGIPVTVASRTAFDGARKAPDLAEALAFVDALAHHDRIRADHLSAYVDDHAGWRGVGQARAACKLMDREARNPWESRLRAVYVLEARLPRPRVNVAVYDLAGRLVGVPDLLDEDTGLVGEFDGQCHRERAQHRADNVREEAFEELGLTVVRADSLDLRDHR